VTHDRSRRLAGGNREPGDRTGDLDDRKRGHGDRTGGHGDRRRGHGRGVHPGWVVPGAGAASRLAG